MSMGGVTPKHHLRAGAAAPREVGPDGRALRRPWRIVSPAVMRRVQQHRATRPQPRWPRVFGMACMGVAILALLDPVVPVSRKVPAPSSARPVPMLVNLRAQSPDG